MFYLKNNLFSYATSELSQDAFICWLLSYVMEDAAAEPRLKQCASDFIKKFTNNKIQGDIVVDHIHRQEANIDIWIEVNKRYAIIIEDKTCTQQHDNQLQRYKEIIGQRYVTGTKDKKFHNDDVYGVYFKTGFQSDLREVEGAGYTYIRREDILEIMARYGDVQNNIFRDFYDYYLSYDQYAKSYQDLPLDQWDSINFYAFFENLKESIKGKYNNTLDSNYLYVANQSGGFYGMWIMNQNAVFVVNSVPCELYLQIESQSNFLNICLKVSLYDTEDSKGSSAKGAIRELLVYRKDKNDEWIRAAEGYDMRTVNCGFDKPGKFSNGKAMTLGIYNKKIENVANAINIITEAIESYRQYQEHLLKDGFAKYEISKK